MPAKNQPSNLGTTLNSNATSDEKYRHLLELSPVPMVIHINGKVVLANQAAASLVAAATPEALVGRNVMDFVHPSSRAAVKKRIELLAQGLRAHTSLLEERLVRLDGSVIEVEIISVVIEYESVPSIQLVLQDVTEKKRIQQKLLQAKDDAEYEKKRLHDLFMVTPAMVAIVKGPSFIFEMANPLYLKVTGKTKQIVGKSVAEVFPELKGQGIIELLERIYATGKSHYGNETLIKLSSGPGKQITDHYFNFVYLPAFDIGKKVDSILVHAVDVTQSVLARQEIENREKQYRSIFDATSDGILIFNSLGQLVETNPAAIKMHGYTYKEMLNLTGLDLIHPDYKSVFEEIATTVSSGGNFRGVGKHQTKQGVPIDVEIVATGMVYNQAPHIMAVVRDITDRLKAAEEVTYTNSVLQTVTDNASLGLFMMDMQLHCTFMNIAAEKITGFTLKDLQEKNLPLHDIIHHSHPDGSHYAIDRCPIDKVLRLQKRQGGDEIFIRADGTFFPVRFMASPIIRNGEAVGTILEVEDLTESLKTQNAIREANKRGKELEAVALALRKQQEELLELNRSKDEFISLASHQLRTPATVVKQYIGMALGGYSGELTPILRSDLQMAYDSNDRQLAIVDDLLKVARVDAGKVKLHREAVNAVQLVASAIQQSEAWFKERNQKVHFVHQQKNIYISADKQKMQMSLENILDNASKYTLGGKKISVNIKAVKNLVYIEIKDQGVGISETDISKVFYKFARIDNPLSVAVGGTGLGLYWTQKIIALHHGAIKVKSKVGVGTSFTIILPTIETDRNL